MNEMVERAVVAISSEAGLNRRNPVCEAAARAAMAAIREPTDAMEAAFNLQGTKRMNFKLQFAAAIDAALSKDPA